MKSVSIPFLGGRLGRLHVAWEKGGALWYPGGTKFRTSLIAKHCDWKGRLIKEHDLGSGLVTNVGVDLMANDFTIAGAPVLKQMNFHGCGTGATAAAATDYYLQTAVGAGSLTGSTNGYFTGSQSYISPNIYQTVATFTYNATLAITEWALFMSNAASFSGRSATSVTNNTMTDTGAAFTTTGNALSGWAVETNASAINTPTTTVWGLILSNTATVLTLAGPAGGAWLTLANAVAANPSGTTNYIIVPGMWDHKQFAAINVNATDTIAFTYKLTINSGG